MDGIVSTKTIADNADEIALRAVGQLDCRLFPFPLIVRPENKKVCPSHLIFSANVSIPGDKAKPPRP